METNSTFDALSEWLEISESHRPPNYYSLLGLPYLEADPERTSAAYALVESAMGLFVAAGTEYRDETAFIDEVLLFAVDGHGDMQWERRHTTGEQIMVEEIVETSDGGLAVAASASEREEPSRVLLLRTDENGTIDEP